MGRWTRASLQKVSGALRQKLGLAGAGARDHAGVSLTAENMPGVWLEIGDAAWPPRIWCDERHRYLTGATPSAAMT
jgi:hypothetical protein